MKKTDFSNLTTEDLKNKKKTFTFVTGLLAGMLITLLVLVAILIIQKGFSAVSMSLIVIPIALSPILIINYGQISLINKELESRNIK